MKPAEGAILDARYEIKGELGSGGMGTVYSAHDIELNRPVAIKILHRDSSEDNDLLKRFEREAKALSWLNHKNILTVYRLGNWRGVPYLVMELLEGESLAALISRKGRLDGAEALYILSEVASAMMVAHSNGIVHRDLKPQNIYLTKTSKIAEQTGVKVIDFGLCKPIQNKADLQRLTTTGLLIGTVNYMSPESCQGQPSTEKSDIYSLGTVLYEALSGELPFDADNPMGVLYQHVNNNAPILNKRFPNLPFAASYDEILRRCLAKHPGARFKSMSEFKSALLELRDQILNNTGAQNPSAMAAKDVKAKNRSSKNFVCCAASIFSVIGALIGGLWYYHSDTHASKKAPTKTPGEVEHKKNSKTYHAVSSKLGRQSNDPVSLIIIAMRDRERAEDLLGRINEHEHSTALVNESENTIGNSITADERAIDALRIHPIRYLLFLSFIGKARSLTLSRSLLHKAAVNVLSPEQSKKDIELAQLQLECLETARQYVLPNTIEEFLIYHDLGYAYLESNNPLKDDNKAEANFCAALRLSDNNCEYSIESHKYVEEGLTEKTEGNMALGIYYTLAKMSLSNNKQASAAKYFDSFYEQSRVSINMDHDKWMERLRDYVSELWKSKRRVKAQEVLVWMETLPLSRRDEIYEQARMYRHLSEAFAVTGNKDKALKYVNKSIQNLERKKFFGDEYKSSTAFRQELLQATNKH